MGESKKVCSFAVCSFRQGLAVSEIEPQVRKGTQLLVWNAVAAKKKNGTGKLQGLLKIKNSQKGRRKRSMRQQICFLLVSHPI